MRHQVPHASRVMVDVDPVTEPGDGFHAVPAHAHDELPMHAHP